MSEKLGSLKIEAYAKLNLGLRVVGKRSDGYHDIETVFQNISLADQIQFTLRKDDQILIKHKSEQEIPLHENLVFKAIQLVRTQLGLSCGLSVRLVKNIPLGSGLGGGSSDAAATLVALNKLLDLELTHPQLMDLALQLGSDVPFFLEGGRCRGAGRGEVLVKVPFRGRSTFVVLFCPRLSLSTKEVFAMFDKLVDGPPNATRTDYQNDLERAAIRVCPDLGAFSRKLATISLSSWMTGSGASYYTITRSPFRAMALSRKAEKELKCKTYVCRLVDRGYQIVD